MYWRKNFLLFKTAGWKSVHEKLNTRQKDKDGHPQCDGVTVKLKSQSAGLDDNAH
jgi:hypothetical protein